MQKSRWNWTKIGLFACILSIGAGIACGLWRHFDADSKDCLAGIMLLILSGWIMYNLQHIKNIPEHAEILTIGNRISVWTVRKVRLLFGLVLIVLVLSQLDFMTGKVSDQDAAFRAQRKQLEGRMGLTATRSRGQASPEHSETKRGGTR
jgi:hypothetical protein